MKNILKILATFLILQNLAACAYLFNSKTVEVAIESSPAGADIIIEGRSYGRTPAVIKIEPKNYIATITKEGYGSAQLKLESWQAIRKDKSEGGRCLADALGTVLILPVFSYWSSYCRDFKEPRYFVSIPYQGPTQASSGLGGAYGGGNLGGVNYGYGSNSTAEYGEPSSNMGYNRYESRGVKRNAPPSNSQNYYNQNFSDGDVVY